MWRNVYFTKNLTATFKKNHCRSRRDRDFLMKKVSLFFNFSFYLNSPSSAITLNVHVLTFFKMEKTMKGKPAQKIKKIVKYRRNSNRRRTCFICGEVRLFDNLQLSTFGVTEERLRAWQKIIPKKD